MVLPHELLPYLDRNGLLPEVDEDELRRFWAHLKNQNVEVAKLVTEEMAPRCHPLFIWGDDAEYNEHHEKLIVMTLGHCLSDETFSIKRNWPLLTIRDDPCS